MVQQIRRLDIDDLFLMRNLLTTAALKPSAKVMFLTQGAVSQRITRLERTFKTKVVERKGRCNVLTSSGRKLCEDVAKILSSLESLENR